MSHKHNHNHCEASSMETEKVVSTPNENEVSHNSENQEVPTTPLQDDRQELLDQIASLEDKNLRMMAEFDNFRKRTNKEKVDLLSSASASVLTELLPIMDDFERANEAINQSDDIEALKQGVALIYNKFQSFLQTHDVHVIDTSVEGGFDTDKHEAVTTVTVSDEAQKGKIIDCVQKGYMLGDKVIRYAKVIIGE